MQYGPGAENAFAGVATAFSDSSPVVFLPLGHPRETAQLFPMFKSSRTYASITKSVEEVILPEQVANVMRRAFSQVKNGRPGPVMVEVPADVVGTEVAVDPNDYRPVRAHPSAGDERDIDEAARMLLDASCPMILAGQGVFYAQATRRTAAARRAAAGAGHDDIRRQERLSGGPSPWRSGPAAAPSPGPAAISCTNRIWCSASAAASPGTASPRRSCRPARRSSTRPTTRATCTRPSPPTRRSSATPSSCSAS